MDFFLLRGNSVLWYQIGKRKKFKLACESHQKTSSFTSFYQIKEVDTDMKTAQRDLLNGEEQIILLVEHSRLKVWTNHLFGSLKVGYLNEFWSD